MIQLSTAVLGLWGFIKDLPEYYKTVSFKDPLCAVILSIHAVMIVGLILSMKSALGSLVIIFILLGFSYLTSWIDEFLRSNVALLLEKKYISTDYFFVKGKFVAAVWTVPIFFYTVFFSLCLILTLLKEILQECRKRTSKAGSSRNSRHEETEGEMSGSRTTEKSAANNIHMHGSTSSPNEHSRHDKHHGGHNKHYAGHGTHANHKHGK
ncbi:Transmembrane domain-containing protein [Giardia duodenalis]|uniref:Transmembrane domain-containing protein n=1 Tax=Giardia intestinalis (strain ATCC 50803 / WB clone C6) TaxID=184922 RepID=A8B5N9_GIAIC|nr:Transmembrane domain-containing protein [Giardia intestinalis]KAE8305137.1 Transmembrane domain-containing protein [Giardia intestinalis]|eukprot:XP_001709270.1 Hypothetical protein GL50803_6917 [Giardia lamblia ATCC 50803]